MIDIQQLPLLWAVGFAATLLRSFTGFGFALAAVPGFALLYSPIEAVALSACLSLALGAQTFKQYRRDLNLSSQWPMFAAAVVGTLIGARVLSWIDRELFLMAIGLLVMMACVALARFRPRRRPVRPALAGGAGLCSGLINGAFAIPGPPIIIYVMSTVPEPRASRALMMGFFSFSSLVAVLTYASAGWVGRDILLLAGVAYPAVWLGDRIGAVLFRRYGSGQYRRVAIAALFALGASLLIKATV